VLYPLLGWIVTGIEVAVILTVLGTALFGSQALSERAFRLLRWVANRPEPPAPEVGPSEHGPTTPNSPIPASLGRWGISPTAQQPTGLTWCGTVASPQCHTRSRSLCLALEGGKA